MYKMGESRPFDSVCALCDNGGEILSCKGKCLRSFHAFKDGNEGCETVGFTRQQIKHLDVYLCGNCLHRQHQCYACGQLGSSAKANREVYICSAYDCGHHYHPKCVSRLIHPNNESKAAQLAQNIKEGSSFTCTRHECAICRGRENKNVRDLQFALCRRCPVAYHRRCLPREIIFEHPENNLPTRAWDGLVEDRIIIYCMKHKIDGSIGTPARNHIKFPENMHEKPKFRSESTTPIVKTRLVTEFDKQPDKKRPRMPDVTSPRAGEKQIGFENNTWHREKQKLFETNPPREKPKCFENNWNKDKQKSYDNDAASYASSFPSIDESTKNKIRDLWESCSSGLTLENVREKFKMPSTHRGMTKHMDLSATEDQIKEAVEIIKTAWTRVNNGEPIEQVKEFCSEDLIHQAATWKNKLNVYLAPFIHMNRYTSFGRHFTKVDKLIEIVERLQWYVNDGDMVVDFCCGSNDFSILMREKLESVGKKCFFKNFDLHEPKNDFNFEKRDWMTVQPSELPDGSRLIMGLNPPFGINASLANKFIAQALKFRPKIMILIVPTETKRLDEEGGEYDLTWFDPSLLSGKSFYLPGSIDDDHNRMEQWNLKPPPLYLWSRRDWAQYHKEIANNHGHFSLTFQDPNPESNPNINNVPIPQPIPNTEIVPIPQPIPNTEIVPIPQPIPNTEIIPIPQPIPNTEIVPIPEPNPSTEIVTSSESNASTEMVPYRESTPNIELRYYSSTDEEEEQEDKNEEEEEDKEEEEEEEEEEGETVGPGTDTSPEEGEITDHLKEKDEGDDSGELIFLSKLINSSPEPDEFQSDYNKNYESGISKIQFDYSSFGPNPSDPLEPGPSGPINSLDDIWSSDNDTDDDDRLIN